MIEKLGFAPQSGEGGIFFWRKNILRMMTLTLVVVGTIAYFPSVWLSLRERLYGLVLATTLAYALLLLTHFSHRLSYYVKVGIVVVVFYCLAVFVFLETGKHGAGLLWLFSVAPIAGLLLGFWHGIYLLVIDAITLSVLGVVLAYQPQAFPALLDFDVTNYIVVSVNFMLVNAVVTLPLAALLDGLRVTIEKERATSQALELSRNKLLSIYQIGVELSSTLDLSQIFRILFSQVVRAYFDSPHLVIALWDKEADLITCQFAIVDGEETDPAQFPAYPLGEGPTSDTIRTAKARVIDLEQARPDLEKKGRLTQIGDNRQPLSAIYVPLIVPDGVLGVLSAQSYEREAYRDVDLDFLTTVCNQASIAIQNATLFQRANSRLQRIEALRSIDRAINQSLDLDSTLHALLQQTMSQLNPDACAVLLLEEGYLCYAASLGFRTGMIAETRLKVADTLAGQALTSRRRLGVPDLSVPDTGFSRPEMAEAEGFVRYSVVPLIAKDEPLGVLQVYHRQQVDLPGEWYDYLETIGGQAAIAVDNAEAYRRLERARLNLERAYDKTLEGWVQALELRDDETREHTERVVSMTLRLAEILGVPPEQLVNIRRGALLHDIGKMGVPDALLFKAGPLTESELEQMRLHPVYAYEWLNPIEYLRPALDIPHYHHEKWDGTGYPSGLKGEGIPLPARIFAVVDVWDALTSDRPYRKAWPRAKALDHIKSQTGHHFDPKVVEAFLTLLGDDDLLSGVRA